jgi:hypothetical protein
LAPGTGIAASGLSLSFGSRGGLGSWLVQRQIPSGYERGVRGTRIGAAGTFGSALTLVPLRPSYDAAHDRLLRDGFTTVAFGENAFAQAWLQSIGGRLRLRVRIGDHGRLTTLAPRAAVESFAIAGNPRGGLAVLYATRAGAAGRRSLYLVTSRRGGRLAAPRRIASAMRPIAGLTVAIDRGGDVLAAWGRSLSPLVNGTRVAPRSVVQARRVDAGGRRHAIATIARGSVDLDGIQAAQGEDGDGVVAWARRVCGDLGCGPLTVEAALSSAGRTFATPQVLEPPVEGSNPQFVVALQAGVAGRRAVVAWNGLAAGRVGVRVATAPAGGRFGPPQELATASAGAPWPELGQLAVAPSGAAGVAFEEHVLPAGAAPDDGTQNTVVRAAFQPAGSGTFGPGETIAAGPLPSVQLSAPPALGFDPAHRTFVAMWRDSAAIRGATRSSGR